MRIFATRSPERPNPIAVSTAYVTYLDVEHGVLGLAWIDALDGTPVLDIKPYTPSADRVGNLAVPAWRAHWPQTAEQSGDFDWEANAISDGGKGCYYPTISSIRPCWKLSVCDCAP